MMGVANKVWVWSNSIAFSGLLLATGCRYPYNEGPNDLTPPSSEASCDQCHGANGDPAPPFDVQGGLLTEERGVGAHQAHLAESDWHAPVLCRDCHRVPGQVNSEGHIDSALPAELMWSARAMSDGARPSWDGRSCTNYCHGQTLEPGGLSTEPVWTLVDNSQDQCDSCHGAPPRGAHPQVDAEDCAQCHGQVIDASGVFIAPELHINGTVEVDGDALTTCVSCHGGGTDPAPPNDTLGHTATDAPGVGAHQAHLTLSDWHASIACESCHQVPNRVDSVGHIDSALPAELVWGPLPKTGGLSPIYSAGGCANYCHGQGFTPAAESSVWTASLDAPLACDSCHAMPPQGAHPEVAPESCAGCHGEVVDHSLRIIAPELHINGTVEVHDPGLASCDRCHGEGGQPAPPRDLQGHVDSAFSGVGAHQSHLSESDWHLQLTCDDCHEVPRSVGAVGHIDGERPADLSWSALASASGVSPEYDGQSCTNYCHGASFLEGDGALTAPSWTIVDGTQAACGTCHGMPPLGNHPDSADCVSCHGMVVDETLSFVAPELHVNGTVEVASPVCTACHGSGAESAPPGSVLGASSQSDPGVGAHRAHLNGGDWHRPVVCEDCHIVPVGVGDPGHLDDWLPAELRWGAVAQSDGASSLYEGGGCTTYCHGQTLAEGGADRHPLWTALDSRASECGACHSLPPGGSHPRSVNCEQCHSEVIGAGFVFVDASRHVDGVVDVDGLACTACHGADGQPAPPRDTQNHLLTTDRGVGAHQSHLASSDWHRPVQCDDCHSVPSTVSSPGHLDSALPAELVWSEVAQSGGVQSTFDGQGCTTYCHGEAQPIWTQVDGTQAVCGTCHGEPPVAPHPQSVRCELCHGDVIGPNQQFINPELHINGVVDVRSQACDSCHGSEGDPAPPSDTTGNLSTSVVGVGAHREHLGVSDWHAPVLCDDCHQVPSSVDAVGHLDSALPAELSFSVRATADGASASFDGVSCTNYCHGQTLLGGGRVNRPVWTKVDGTQAACGTCHGLPPVAPHPASAACETCHGDVIDAQGTIIAPLLHINGVVDVVSMSCDSCHGQPGQPAPPSDLSGSTATTSPGVGAHRSHLAPSNSHRTVLCEDCHRVPATVDGVGHLDGDGRAELSWAGLASGDAAQPSYAQGSCTNYCHGQTLLPGGVNTQPNWTTVDGSQAACGTCHGLPPGGRHPSSSACELCHGDVIDASGAFVAPERHINGVVDVIDVQCGSCHGQVGAPAPPADLSGNVDPTFSGVGAHQSHLQSSTWHQKIGCTDCHLVPTAVDSVGHIDSARPAELTFSALANTGSASASYASGGCTNYCHGQTLPPGGTNTAPNWTTVNGSQAACGTCHGLPPGGTHPASTACELCHGEVIDASGAFVAPERHINGVVDVVSQSCDSCHGSVASFAPPADLTGASSTALSGVGAHQSHLQSSTWHAPLQCTDCHVIPTAVDSVGHIDSARPAELTFSALANTGGASASYVSGGCTNYCHGQTLAPGGTNTAPSWTTVDGSQAACGTCHGLPPGGAHPVSAACETCHGDVIDAQGTIIAPALHINGQVEVVGQSCDSCHGSQVNAAPPFDLSGNTQVGAPGVGAHQSHLASSGWRAAVLCEDCHLVPATVDAVGHLDQSVGVELTWSALASASGASPTYSAGGCANYCHGRTLEPGGTNTQPDWTTVDGTQAACGTCHGLPPGGRHTTNTSCELCHGDVIDAAGQIIAPSRHVDGVVDVISLTCDSCHGGAGDPSPPVDLSGQTLTTQVGVGAHRSHLQTSTWRASVLCEDCHVVPMDLNSVGHIDSARPAEVIFSPLATANGTSAQWSGSSCTTYCHGASLIAGGTNLAPNWTTVDGSQAACGTCHGLPPQSPHPNATSCELCHGDVIDAAGQIIAPSRHIDGVVDVIGQACDSCHGQAGQAAPPLDLAGGSLTGSTGVGAHQSHLQSSTWRAPIDCTECHVVPSAVDSVGHIDSARPAELVFGGLAASGGVVANWNGSSCTSYCHGASLIAGGTNIAPNWTTVDGSQAACGTCHGLPPQSPHPNATSCELCHGDVIDAAGQIIAPLLHINGVVDVIGQACDSCHGQAGQPAPPKDLGQNTATTNRGVGAHQSHLQSSTWRAPIDCTECHVLPSAVDSVGHIDSARPAELVFGPLASSGAVSPSWDGLNCTSYCHGASLIAGGTNTSPSWTLVDGSQASCGTCHGLPPQSPHPNATSCELCHGDVIDAAGQIIAPSRHINGVVDVIAMSCSSCHGTGASNAPPVDLSGSSATLDAGVGAHQSHLRASNWRAPVPCSACHVVPVQVDDVGHIDSARPAEVRFGALANQDGVNASYSGTSCASYCHGVSLIAGGTNTSPNWTTVNGTQAACGTCHSNPPGGSHPADSACETCHGTVIAAGKNFVDPSKHIDGVVQVTCLGCHELAQGVGGYRRPVVGINGDYIRPSHHVSDGTPTEIAISDDCMVCHNQSGHQGHADPGVLLNDPDLGGQFTHTYDGQGASLELFCLGCHDAGGPQAFDRDANPANGSQPFSDGRTPPVIASNWALASHNATAPLELGRDACLACHGGADSTRVGLPADQDMHGSDWPFLLSPTVAGRAPANPEEALCQTCHDGGVAQTDLQAEFQKGQNGADIFHHPVDDAEQVGGRSVECTSCHDPHAATSGERLRGVAGIDVNGQPVVAGQTPTQYQLCNRCHGASFNTGRPRTTDKQLDFNPVNSSFHPVDSVGRNQSTAINNQLIGGLSSASTIDCTDCHNSEQTADVLGLASGSAALTQGPHGSTQPFILRGAYWSDSFGPTSWNAANFELCFLCHDVGAFNDSKARSDLTNFSKPGKNFHGKHLVSVASFQVSCATCHYNTHSNEGLQTTDYLVDGLLFSGTPASAKTRGVGFAPEIGGAGGYNRPTFSVNTQTRERQCYLSCHGKDHKPEKYTPDPATDDDALTLP